MPSCPARPSTGPDVEDLRCPRFPRAWALFRARTVFVKRKACGFWAGLPRPKPQLYHLRLRWAWATVPASLCLSFFRDSMSALCPAHGPWGTWLLGLLPPPGGAVVLLWGQGAGKPVPSVVLVAFLTLESQASLIPCVLQDRITIALREPREVHAALDLLFQRREQAQSLELQLRLRTGSWMPAPLHVNGVTSLFQLSAPISPLQGRINSRHNSRYSAHTVCQASFSVFHTDSLIYVSPPGPEVRAAIISIL